MLEITIPKTELWDERTGEFITIKETHLKLEHSLVSISKWESKWCKPFFDKNQKTTEETIDYIKCMTITQNVDPNVYLALNTQLLDQILKYINAPMTATTIRKDSEKKGGAKKIITSEVIYYWMITLNIPMECQKWHVNRLLMLIEVCNAENAPKKKMSQSDLMRRNAALNKARRKRMRSKG